MKKAWIVVDMQNDFVTGALGTPEAAATLSRINERLRSVEPTDMVFYTLDTHGADYLSTAEGRKLPVVHCVKGTWGHALAEGLELPTATPVEKPTFGSLKLAETLCALVEAKQVESVELMGVCTDICVISNAVLIKACCPELPISVKADCCAGVTPEKHLHALDVMRSCQVDIL